MDINNCTLCPRSCGVDREREVGFCGVGDEIRVAKAFRHMWEEPCVSGENGSGTIFFSNCNMGCVFCQNYEISHEGFGKAISSERLAEIMLELQGEGCNNINLVTPTAYVTYIKEAIEIAKGEGLNLPIIYNSSGYETLDTIKGLEGYIDVYLPDIKYFSDKYSIKYSKAPNYFFHASRAVLEMFSQVGAPSFKDGIISRGLMIRHLMLPGLLFDSKKIVDWVAQNLPSSVYLNIMCQYTPMGAAPNYPEINRTLNKSHYEALIDYAIEMGVEKGFFQDFDSASEKYTPNFDLEGIEK